MKWMVLVAAFMACTAVVYCNRRCQTASDCNPNECCVTRHESRPVGKCRRLGSQRSHCTTEPLSGDSNGGKYKRYCPCRDGLTCETPERYRQSTFLKRETTKRCITPTATTSTGSSNPTSEAITPSSRTTSEATTPSSRTTSEATTLSSSTIP
ncbi:hypothetical protein TNIN_284331 [Trichonephila inaurata madagascariensis]|uniref:Uncharacterized protein n=1 Tax=Trichonephila inaurata madagascariensis TaxID=2747483 RepID=A0A8X6YI42_9ARAC|nr:hypothetical protein TNIN_284331 [Trichonephila inaurata madagascariensis]